MKKALQKILTLMGSLFILIFCVSAVAGISSSADVAFLSFSEPLNMLLLGFTLVGFGTIFRSRKTKP